MNDMTPSRPNNLDALWMPYSNNRDFKSNPRLLARAEGMSYFTPEGREVIDGTAGLWCCNAGHGRREITEAIQKQAAIMDFAPTFQMGHPLAFQAAARVAEMLPKGLDRVFFTNSGSESADTALKIALAYHRACGQAQRTRLVGRERGYHGVGFGGMSVGGIGANRKQFGSMLPYVDHLPHTHAPDHNAFSRGAPEWGAHLADTLENLVALHGADTIAAVMVEPVAGSTGVLVPPVGYLKRLRDICTRHGILLIFDEVITGFSRIGTPFGSERVGVIPDILTMAKGLTNAAVPMGGVAVSDAVYRGVVDNSPAGIELFHGYTYSGHPLAAAAAIAACDLHVADDLPGRVMAMEPYWENAAHCLKGEPNVIDIRNFGLIAGIELASRPGKPGDRALRVFSAASMRACWCARPLISLHCRRRSSPRSLTWTGSLRRFQTQSGKRRLEVRPGLCPGPAQGEALRTPMGCGALGKPDQPVLLTASRQLHRAVVQITGSQQPGLIHDHDVIEARSTPTNQAPRFSIARNKASSHE